MRTGSGWRRAETQAAHRAKAGALLLAASREAFAGGTIMQQLPELFPGALQSPQSKGPAAILRQGSDTLNCQLSFMTTAGTQVPPSLWPGIKLEFTLRAAASGTMRLHQVSTTTALQALPGT